MITTATNLDGFANISHQAHETELSSRLKDAIAPSIPLHLLMKNVVDVFVMVLQDDGAVFPASVIAASLALADSGVEVYDLVTAFSVAVIPRSLVNTISSTSNDDGDGDGDDDGGISIADANYHLLADPSAKEILAAKGVLTIAMMKNWKEVVFWDQTGSLPAGVATEASELCREGCVAMHKFMRQALVGN